MLVFKSRVLANVAQVIRSSRKDYIICNDNASLPISWIRFKVLPFRRSFSRSMTLRSGRYWSFQWSIKNKSTCSMLNLLRLSNVYWHNLPLFQSWQLLCCRSHNHFNFVLQICVLNDFGSYSRIQRIDFDRNHPTPFRLFVISNPKQDGTNLLPIRTAE